MLTIYYCGRNYRVPREFDYPIPNARPKEQVAFAREIAKRVNNGEDIYLATNSDYMIIEFNILLGLCGNPTLTEQWGYSKDEWLRAEVVTCYDGDILCDITQKEGIELKSADEVIDKQNSVREAIIWGEE